MLLTSVVNETNTDRKSGARLEAQERFLVSNLAFFKAAQDSLMSRVGQLVEEDGFFRMNKFT